MRGDISKNFFFSQSSYEIFSYVFILYLFLEIALHFGISGKRNIIKYIISDENKKEGICPLEVPIDWLTKESRESMEEATERYEKLVNAYYGGDLKNY